MFSDKFTPDAHVVVLIGGQSIATEWYSYIWAQHVRAQINLKTTCDDARPNSAALGDHPY